MNENQGTCPVSSHCEQPETKVRFCTFVPLLYMANMQSMCRVCPHLTNFPTNSGWML